MKKFREIPRIIKIAAVKGFDIYCVYNNGEYRVINFTELFEKWKTKKTDFEFPLKNEKTFKRVQLCEGTLAWPNIKKKLKIADAKEFDTYLDFDPVVLYDNSVPDEKGNQKYEIGHLLKAERRKAGLTQEELAIRSGTTKNYISKIENNKLDIELKTLSKIVEIGLDKNLEIGVV